MDERFPAQGLVVATCRSAQHTFSKLPTGSIQLVEGLGIEGDAHQGATVKHRSRVRKNPAAPNLRQVHLIHEELLDELNAVGYRVEAGALGENITTRGIDLLALPRGTKLRLGDRAVIEITGLRDPCRQLNDFQTGLMQAVLDRDANGNLVRKAGVMSVVVAGGAVSPGQAVVVEWPAGPHLALEVV